MQLSEYLTDIQVDHQVICQKDSFIDTNVKNSKSYWTPPVDNMVYAGPETKYHIYAYLRSLSFAQDDIILPNSMRELYILIDFFQNNDAIQPIIKFYILHPDEYRFLTTAEPIKSRIIAKNRAIFKALHEQGCLISPNENKLKKSLGVSEAMKNTYFPYVVTSYEGRSDEKLKSDKPTIACISRFVPFKIATLLSFLISSRKIEARIVVVGYGRWQPVVSLITSVLKKFYKSDITFLGKQTPEDLSKIILKSDIGFAQGTTILQFTKYGIPTIIAPYSKWHQFLYRNIGSPGVFGVDGQIDYGDVYASKSYRKVTEYIEEIKKDYEHFCEVSKRIMLEKLNKEIGLKNFSEELMTRRNTFEMEGLALARPNWLKRLIKGK